MDEMTDNELLEYNRLGLIPGPGEREEAFVKRARFCLELKGHIKAELRPLIPFDVDKDENQEAVVESCQDAKALYDISPSWIPIFFSNRHLAPWHGGCAWIFQIKEDSPTAAFLQLRGAFRNASRYMGIYDRNELIAHELAHVGRMTFHEPKFEEILAFRSSRSSWRRWLGPIVSSSFEALLFFISLLIIFILDISSLGTGSHGMYQIAMWVKLLPIAFVAFALIRLWHRQRIFSCCVERLTSLLKDTGKAQAVAYRLQDREIAMFARMSPQDIQCYAQEQPLHSLRWRVMNKVYF